MKLLAWNPSTGTAGLFFSVTQPDSLTQTRAGRIQNLSLSFPPSPPTPRPANASFPFGGFSSVAGKYNNLGYGPVELCLVSPKDPNPSSSCNDLATNISIILPGATPPDVPTFFAKWESPFFSHLRFTHFDGAAFNLSALSSFVSRLDLDWILGGLIP